MTREMKLAAYGVAGVVLLVTGERLGGEDLSDRGALPLHLCAWGAHGAMAVIYFQPGAMKQEGRCLDPTGKFVHVKGIRPSTCARWMRLLPRR